MGRKTVVVPWPGGGGMGGGGGSGWTTEGSGRVAPGALLLTLLVSSHPVSLQVSEEEA